MPPKKDGPSKKSQDKAKKKVIEDKTFGLKNKNKSKTVQKFVKGVESSVGANQKGGGKTYEQKQKEKQEEEAKRLEQSLFKPVVAAQKTPVGKIIFGDISRSKTNIKMKEWIQNQ